MMDSYRDAIDQISWSTSCYNVCRLCGTTCEALLAVGQAFVSGILTVLVVLTSVQNMCNNGSIQDIKVL